jgi:hypothetical protein
LEVLKARNERLKKEALKRKWNLNLDKGGSESAALSQNIELL